MGWHHQMLAGLVGCPEMSKEWMLSLGGRAQGLGSMYQSVGNSPHVRNTCKLAKKEIPERHSRSHESQALRLGPQNLNFFSYQWIKYETTFLNGWSGLIKIGSQSSGQRSDKYRFFFLILATWMVRAKLTAQLQSRGFSAWGQWGALFLVPHINSPTSFIPLAIFNVRIWANKSLPGIRRTKWIKE